MRILVVEDERKVAKALQEGLEGEGYEVAAAHTGEEGFFLANTQAFDLVVLDLMLPGRDGLEVLGALRKRGLATPVLILTAKDAVEDRVFGLDAGADDYARIVTRSARPLDLTAREFELLEYLLRNQGQVVSREMIARDVWKETARHTPLDNVIDVHIARLRRKVDDSFDKKLVHTVRGVGFVLREEARLSGYGPGTCGPASRSGMSPSWPVF